MSAIVGGIAMTIIESMASHRVFAHQIKNHDPEHLDRVTLGLGKAIEGGMNAMGRQPEAIGQIQTAMIIGCAFIEALTIYALLTVLILQGKIAG